MQVHFAEYFVKVSEDEFSESDSGNGTYVRARSVKQLKRRGKAVIL